jgi:hypothetical protein
MANRDYDYGSSYRQSDYDYDYGRQRGGTTESFDQDYGYRSGRQGSNQGYGTGRGGYGRGSGRQSSNYYGSRQGYGQDYDLGDYDQDYGYGGRQGYGSQPMTWSYTEIWLIPGPQTGKGPANYQRSDERICEDVSERLTQHGQVDASNIEVDVQNGEVTLKGTVNNRKEKRMAEDCADSVSGVKDVHNQLKIEQQGQQRMQQQNQQSQQQRQLQGQSPEQQRQAGQNQPQTQQQQPQGQTQNQR